MYTSSQFSFKNGFYMLSKAFLEICDCSFFLVPAPLPRAGAEFTIGDLSLGVEGTRWVHLVASLVAVVGIPVQLLALSIIVEQQEWQSNVC